ncbi:hypothetical protein BCV71DRAFT_186962 [Rhizopus microsporus]|uniref:Uncharacterized protein n=1 Tax=Rhizopus microsporus TaxID=58291 RepID=A0A1X0RRE9_RHIZD|nr:hypothetical protein BCV71DRAFT_186962 [Rhizopus microsporus]
MINRPNHVIQNQRHFQASTPVPLWLKGKRDKLFVSIVFVGLTVGVLGAFEGTIRYLLYI